MTKELLAKANALNKRIALVNELIDSAKDMPIMIQSGMGKVVQFDFDTDNVQNEVQGLDNELHDRIIDILNNYVFELTRQFDGLGED